MSTTELKQIIHTHLSQMNIQSVISTVIQETLNDENLQNLTEDQLLSTLNQNGILNEVMSKLKLDTRHLTGDHSQPVTSFVGTSSAAAKTMGVGVGAAETMGVGMGTLGTMGAGMGTMGTSVGTVVMKQMTENSSQNSNQMTERKLNDTEQEELDVSRRYLRVSVLRGRAFIDHMTSKAKAEGLRSYFNVELSFRGHRFKSHPVPCSCDPDFQQSFLFPLIDHNDEAGMVDGGWLLSVCEGVRLVLIRTDAGGDRSLVSCSTIEWRSILSTANTAATIELLGTGEESKVTMGLLDLRLDLVPELSQLLTPDIISTQLSMEKTRRSERERLFLVYAKQWWKEFLEIRPTHKHRTVKIFAQDESGNNKPVCCYVRPMRAGRLLESPRAAARFVSLMSYERTSGVLGQSKAELWSNSDALLAVARGDCEDHSTLLCSLLLGFGLDAYVCVGGKSKGELHTWVMTLSPDGTATFWESLTGHRYTHRPVDVEDLPLSAQYKPSHPYRTVGCVFNHNTLYANCQVSDEVDTCIFDLMNDSHWKSMSSHAVRSLADVIMTSPAPLSPSDLNHAHISNQLEHELRDIVALHRQDVGLSTLWDDDMSYILTMALSSYETDRLTGISGGGNEEFQQSIRRAVPDGHTFKGYPVQFIHRNARRAFYTSLKSSVCEEIVSCRGDEVRLAVRVVCYTYPENTLSTWIMFACRYKSIL